MAEKRVGKLEFSLMTSVKGASRRTPRKNHDGDGLLKWRDVLPVMYGPPVTVVPRKQFVAETNKSVDTARGELPAKHIEDARGDLNRTILTTHAVD